MKLKTLIVSVVILAVISAVVFMARRPGPPVSQDPRVGQPIADHAVVEKAAKLKISDQGKTIELARQSDGSWRDTSYYDLPADFSKLSGFVGNLTEAKVDRFVTANPDRLSRLEFKDTRIELLDTANKPLWSVTLGKNADSGGRFLRFDDEKKGYLASLNAWIDTEAKSWANAELLNLKPDDIAKVEISFPETAAPAGESKAAVTPTTVRLSRAKKDDAWTADVTPANQKVNTDKVASVLSSAGALRFTDTSDLNDPNVAAAKAHERSIKLTTFDGKTYTVAMGRKPEVKTLKPVAPAAVAKPGAKADEATKAGEKTPEPKPAAPEYETTPAGPVYVFISSSDSTAPVNTLMQKRAFQIADYVFTGLPQKAEELFQPAPPPTPAPKADEKKPASAEPESPKPPEAKK